MTRTPHRVQPADLRLRDVLDGLTAARSGDFSTRLLRADDPDNSVIDEIATVFNGLNDQLALFTSQVTRVAREVGTEGQLGGQVQLPGLEGTWKDLADSVNSMAGNLRQTAITNQEQDWLQTNLARMASLMQGQRDLSSVGELIMAELIPLVGAQHGTFFLADMSGPEAELRLIAGYGLPADTNAPCQFTLGQSLIGQAAKSKKPIVVTDLPADYVKISSGLGAAAPVNLMVLPIVVEDEVLGVIEVASFSWFTGVQREFMEQLMEIIGVNVKAIIANSRTDALLAESQRLTAELQARTGELQAQQEELQRSNADLEDKAMQLARQNRDIELKNVEIELARQQLEERALQLDQASRYKSQFLANMSHELRTPLNSLLILARLLADNPEQTLTAKQVEYAKVIYSSGSDLLQLINDILDLSRVEAGKMELHPERFAVRDLVDDLRTVFVPLTSDKGLRLIVSQVPRDVPAELFTDRQRLRQILHNLLANAVKFTEHGHVALRITAASPDGGPSPGLAFAVTDTGIGISEQNLATIFGPFQQGDGTTSRRYGGTGLGLAICQELAGRLGGRVTATSVPGEGSTFTLCLPQELPAQAEPMGAAREEVSAAPRPAGPAASEEAASDGRRAHPDGAWRPGLDGKKVLVVDDDHRNAFAITSILELYGLTVLHASDGQAAIGLLRTEGDIDIVLMDLMMPELDGYATIAAIRQMPGFEELPIIAVTARAMHGDRDKSVSAGANDYVTKPVDTEELLTCVERSLGPSLQQ
jgi:signal transduction histidine kinase